MQIAADACQQRRRGKTWRIVHLSDNTSVAPFNIFSAKHLAACKQMRTFAPLNAKEIR